jgi:hypothetical protein
LEREIVHHFGCINGRILQACSTKHVQHLIIVVDKPRERAIVRQGCHNTSIIINIASNTWEREIVRHIASNRIEIETLIAWHGHVITSNQVHMINNVGIKQSITWENERSI